MNIITKSVEWICADDAHNWRIRRNIFIMVHTLLWLIIPAVLCMLTGMVFGLTGYRWNEIVMSVTGMSAFFIGFAGGCIILMRNINKQLF